MSEHHFFDSEERHLGTFVVKDSFYALAVRVDLWGNDSNISDVEAIYPASVEGLTSQPAKVRLTANGEKISAASYEERLDVAREFGGNVFELLRAAQQSDYSPVFTRF